MKTLFNNNTSNTTENTKLRVLTIPAFHDNYLWLIHDDQHAAVVDPGDAAPVIAALEAHKLTLSAILLTHHHADHVGGVQTLLQHFAEQGRKLPVYGPAREKITGVTTHLSEGDVVHLPELSLNLSVLEVPGHTLGHIAYVAAEQNWLFCGDTLFAGGCGRLFEGTPAQMTSSLSKLASLPVQTQVFCAHEYTMANLRFAFAVEPGNAALRARIAQEQAKRDQHIPTVPSSIGLENATNPFLRYQQAEVIATLKHAGRLDTTADAVQTFAALREWKNTF
ncbi:hydroxyacylglutathione hydrolase [Glaciimonas soli]|uniref:Hydroxyacylglutathione hydrolase n=1 Tax=Glaciimonas soli TaxID=2590999 RepID=A0A843YQM0_9BURK|nr:hydroxyacylglutathione hydrolase [Glaciimonas soli]MQQ99787.1 hydroxyacylglutathione hydrolase [Glaciimonas soli]